MSQTGAGVYPRLAWRHVGPPREESVPVPPLAWRLAEYALVYDHARDRLVYAVSPQPHQFGHAWTWTGGEWRQLSSRAVRIGSAQQEWRGSYDPRHACVIGWTWQDGPVGVLIEENGTRALVPPGTRRFDDNGISLEYGGDVPSAPAKTTWKSLKCVLAGDRARGVTTCLTQGGLYELDDLRWTRRAEHDARLMPNDVDGDASHGFSAGAGALYDEVRKRVVFWLHDHEADDVRFLAWDGVRLTRLPNDGLPELWRHFGDDGFAVGEHPEHGVVVYAGPSLGLFGMTDQGFTRLHQCSDAPPRGKAGQLAFDKKHGALALGPYRAQRTPQNCFHVLQGEKWSRQGSSTTKSLLADLSSGYIGFARTGEAMHAASGDLRTAAWHESRGWHEVVDEKAADKARDGRRAQVILCAFDNKAHAIMDDGSVLVLDNGVWREIASASKVAKDLDFPLAAFDAQRRTIVAWGSRKKKGGRKNDTFLFDGKDWTKAKKSAAPDDIDDGLFDLYFDPQRKAVVRLSSRELAVFDGATWNAQRVVGGDAIDNARRCVIPGHEVTHIVNVETKSIARLEGNKVEVVARFDPPAPRETHQNLPFDRWWPDPERRCLVVHNDSDDRASWRLDLLP